MLVIDETGFLKQGKASCGVARQYTGSTGTLARSQVAAVELNEMRMRIYGETGSLDWRQMDPNRLVVKRQDGPEEIHHAAAPYLGDNPLSTKGVGRAFLCTLIRPSPEKLWL